MSAVFRKLLAGLVLAFPIVPASANVIVDWDAKAVAIIAPAVPAPLNQREAAMVDVAMFDAVNAIERRYQSYLYTQGPAPETSQDAAAAAAAAAVLTGLHPEVANDIKAQLGKYLAAIADGPAKQEGVEVGDAAAAEILRARATDGA